MTRGRVMNTELLEDDLTQHYLVFMEDMRDEIANGVPRFLRGATARWNRKFMTPFARFLAQAHALALVHYADFQEGRSPRSYFVPPEG